MDKNYLVQLTTNLYRLTLLFPKKEPLRYKIRELADEILAKCSSSGDKHHENKTENHSPRILEDLEVLDSFFEVAKSQNWTSPFDILEIQEKYGKIKEDLKNSKLEEKKVMEKKTIEKQGVMEIGSPLIGERSPRHQKILEILKEKKRVQVGEIKQIFPEVTKRTLRRDFKQLLKLGLIEKIGERNDTFYQIIK